MSYSCQPTLGGPDSLTCFQPAARGLGNEVPGWTIALHSEGEHGSLVTASSCHCAPQRADNVGREDVPFPPTLTPSPFPVYIFPHLTIVFHPFSPLTYPYTHTPTAFLLLLRGKSALQGSFIYKFESIGWKEINKSTLPSSKPGWKPKGYWFRPYTVFPRCSFHQSLPCQELERIPCCCTKDILLYLSIRLIVIWPLLPCLTLSHMSLCSLTGE